MIEIGQTSVGAGAGSQSGAFVTGQLPQTAGQYPSGTSGRLFNYFKLAILQLDCYYIYHIRILIGQPQPTYTQGGAGQFPQGVAAQVPYTPGT